MKYVYKYLIGHTTWLNVRLFMVEDLCIVSFYVVNIHYFDLFTTFTTFDCYKKMNFSK